MRGICADLQHNRQITGKQRKQVTRQFINDNLDQTNDCCYFHIHASIDRPLISCLLGLCMFGCLSGYRHHHQHITSNI